MHAYKAIVDYLMHLFTVVPHLTLTVLYFVVFSYIVQLTSNTVEAPPFFAAFNILPFVLWDMLM